MKTKKQKESEWEGFRDSDKFGKHTYSTIYVLRFNLKNTIRLVELYAILIKKLDENVIKHSLNESQLLRIKQHIVLDSISKIMVLIESTLMLCYALSQGYSKVPEIMTYYELTKIDSAINSIKKEEYNMRKILGLPDLNSLNLSESEKKFLGLRYEHTSKVVYRVLKNWIDFYSQFRIIYGKTKHGLSFHTGLGKTSEKPTKFENSLLIAFDRRQRKEMPPGTFISKNPLGVDSDWFTSQSFLKISEKLFKEMSTIMHDLEEFTGYLCSNQLTYAENCGENYLPYVNNNSKIEVVFYGDPYTDEESETLNSIVEKILPEMNIPSNRLLNYNVDFTDEKMIESMNNDIITNFWIEKT